MFKLFVKFSVGTLLSAAISLFTTPIITSLIVPDDFGKASMFTVIFYLLLNVSMLGIDQSYVRNFYAKKGNAEQSELFLNSLIFPVVVFVLISVLLLVFGGYISKQLVGQESLKVTVILVLTIFFGILERFLVLRLRMEQKAIAFSSIRVVASVINFLIVYWYAVTVAADFYAILWGTLVSLIVSCFISLLFSPIKMLAWNFNKKEIYRLALYGLPFVPAFISGWLFEGIDKIALRKFADFNELGLFSASYKIVGVLSILQLGFSNFWIPVSMELYENRSNDTAKKFSQVFSIVAAALFIGALFLIAGKDIVMLLFDAKYSKAIEIMPFLLLVPIMYTLSEITVAGINYSKNTIWHFYISLLVALINVGLNFVLVPKLGAKGAAIATGISYILFFALRTVVGNNFFRIEISIQKFILSLSIFLLIAYINTFPQMRYILVINFISIIVIGLVFGKEILNVSKQVLGNGLIKK